MTFMVRRGSVTTVHHVVEEGGMYRPFATERRDGDAGSPTSLSVTMVGPDRSGIHGHFMDHVDAVKSARA